MDKACQNHNRVIWRQDMQDPMDPGNYYAPSIFVVGESAIGIDVGGRAHVMDVREWAAQAAEIARLRAELAQARAEFANELTERDAARAEAKRLQDLIERRRIERDDIRASAARWEESALNAERERDRVYDDTERTRYDIWCLAEEYKDQWVRVDPKGVAEDIRDLLHTSDRPPLVERQRRTIRALVVAARGMYYALLRAMIRYESVDETPEQTERRLRNATTRIKFGMMRTREVERAESGQQAGEGA